MRITCTLAKNTAAAWAAATAAAAKRVSR